MQYGKLPYCIFFCSSLQKKIVQNRSDIFGHDQNRFDSFRIVHLRQRTGAYLIHERRTNIKLRTRQWNCLPDRSRVQHPSRTKL